jgi:hypothetical protein
VKDTRSDAGQQYTPVHAAPRTNTVHHFHEDPAMSWLMPYSRADSAPTSFPVKAQVIGDAVPVNIDMLRTHSDTRLFMQGKIPDDSFYDTRNAAEKQWLDIDDDVVMVVPAVTKHGAIVALMVQEMPCTLYIEPLTADLTTASVQHLITTKSGVEPMSVVQVHKNQLCGATFEPKPFFEVRVRGIVAMREVFRKLQYSSDTLYVWHADRRMWSDALTFTRESGLTPQSWVTVSSGDLLSGQEALTGAHADVLFYLEDCTVEYADPPPEAIVPTSPRVLWCEDNENYCKKSGSMVNTKQWENALFQMSAVAYGVNFDEERGLNGIMGEFLISATETEPSPDYTLIRVRNTVEFAQCRRRLMKRMMPTHRGGHNMVGFDDMDMHNQLVLSNPAQRTVWFQFDPQCGGPEDVKLREALAVDGVYDDAEKPDIPPHMRHDDGQPTEEGEKWQRAQMAQPAIREGLTDAHRARIVGLNMKIMVQRFIFLAARNRRPWIHAEPSPKELSVLRDVALSAPVELKSLPHLATAITRPSVKSAISAVRAMRADMEALSAVGHALPEWWEDKYMFVAEQCLGMRKWSLADAEWLDYIPGATYYKQPTVLHSNNVGDSIQAYYKSSMIQLFDTMCHATGIWPGQPRGLDAVAGRLELAGKAEMGYGTLFRLYRDWQKAVAASGGQPPAAAGIRWRSMEQAARAMRLIGEYCVHDGRLVGLVYDKANLATDVAAKSNVSSVSETDVCLRGSSAKGYIATVVQAVAMGVVVNTGDVPYAPRDAYGDRDVQGAHVFPAMRGLHSKFWGFTLDFNSLYPSIAQQENYCTSSVIVSDAERAKMEAAGVRIHHTRLEGVDLYVRQFNCKDHRMPQGVLPALWKKLIGARNVVKKEMKKVKDPSMKGMLNARQLALKILANSLYGCFGFRQFAIKNFRSVAALITAGGRMSIKATEKAALEDFPDERLLSMRDALCEEAGVGTHVWDAHFVRDTPMVFRSGDTDSGFVRAPFKTEKQEGVADVEIRKLVIVFAKWMAADITKRHFNKHMDEVGYKAMNLAFEYIILNLIIFMQKNYFGTVWERADDKPSKLKKGLMKKDDLPEVLKSCMVQVATALQDIDIERAKAEVRKTHQAIIDNRMNPSPFVKRIKIKDPSQLKNTNVPHAHQYYNIMKRVHAGLWEFEVPEFGNKMPTVKRQPPSRAANANASAMWWEHPDWMKQERIPVDVVYYMQQLLSKVYFMANGIPEFQTVYDLTESLVSDAKTKYGLGVDVDAMRHLTGTTAVDSRIVHEAIKERRRASTRSSLSTPKKGEKKRPPVKGTAEYAIAQRKAVAKRLKN